MKNIDIKSLIIGALLTSTIFLSVAATGPRDEWDNEQEWIYTSHPELNALGLWSGSHMIKGPNGLRTVNRVVGGWEPFAVGDQDKLSKRTTTFFRKRIK